MFRSTVFGRNMLKLTRHDYQRRQNQSSFIEKFKANQLPLWAGLSVIGLFHYRRIRRQHDEEINNALEQGKLKKIEVDVPWKIQLYNSLPLNSLSQWAGDLSKREIPRWARRLIFGTYCWFYQVNLDEAIESDLTQYPTLNEFFRRKLKPECRPIDQNADLVVPCDGKVLHCGVITDENQVEQVKGMTYTLNEFLGESYNNLQIKDENCLHQIIMYLAPGDYHCFHSPTDWSIEQRRHFSGKLLSVKPSVATWMPKLFAQNERVVYIGKKNSNSNFFSYTAVGATNVGSILIRIDPELNMLGTNCNLKNGFCRKQKWNCNLVGKGEFFGEFNLGSTIVLIFEAPKDFQFNVKSGENVKVGQKL